MDDFEAYAEAMKRAKAWGNETEVIVSAIKFAIQSDNKNLTVEECLAVGLIEWDV